MDNNSRQNIDAWKIFRIQAEFVDGFETMNAVGPSVSIFGSARAPRNSPAYELATVIAEKIAKKGFGIITGGGPGVMEAANKGAQKANGASCGISINLPYEEEPNPYIDKKYRLSFRYFFVRKVMFIRYAQAFVFLPGGYGTFDELFEALTLIQTKKIRHFPIFLVGTEYWKGLIDWLKNVPLQEKCLSTKDFELLTLTDDPDFIADEIEKHYNRVGSIHTFELGRDQPPN